MPHDAAAAGWLHMHVVHAVVVAVLHICTWWLWAVVHMHVVHAVVVSSVGLHWTNDLPVGAVWFKCLCWVRSPCQMGWLLEL